MHGGGVGVGTPWGQSKRNVIKSYFECMDLTIYERYGSSDLTNRIARVRGVMGAAMHQL